VRIAKPRNPNAVRPNQPPIAVLVVVSARYESEDVIVSTAGTRDPEGGTVSGDVDWGDGDTTTYSPPQEIYAHLYAAPGTYTLTLTVHDSAGAESQAMAALTLVVEPDPSPLPDPDDPPGDPAPENVSPVVVLTYASGQFAGQPYTFSTVGTVDADGSLASYAMDWGDDTEPDTGVLLPDTLTHTYATTGTYTATLTVTDAGSPALSGSAVRTVTIQSAVIANQAPICAVTLVSGFYVGDFTFALTAHDADGAIGSYAITHGDGTASGTIAGPPPATYTHTYGTAHASRTLTLTVSDGSLTTSGSVTFAVVARPPIEGGDHAYFEAMTALPECIKSLSLRSQAQLDSLVNVDPSVFWTYDPDTDDYDTPQDAARLFKPPRNTFTDYPAYDFLALGDAGDEGVHAKQALRVGIPASSSTLFIAWDMWFGPELYEHTIGLGFAFKMILLFCGNGPNTAAKIYQILHERYSGGGLDFNLDQISRHHDDSEGTALPFAAGVDLMDPFQPTGPSAALTGTHKTYHSVWTRYWLEIVPNQAGSTFTDWATFTGDGLPSGTYDRVSLWMADENNARARVLYRVPFKRLTDKATGLPYSHIGQFRISFDTSTNNTSSAGLTGPLYVYARNLVMLHGKTISEGDASLWTQPT